jgi:hypothetical protein
MPKSSAKVLLFPRTTLQDPEVLLFALGMKMTKIFVCKTLFFQVRNSSIFLLLPLLNSIDMGADSQSPLGTAFAFSRPSKVALRLSNTSLLLEYTSRVFINSLQEPDNNR